MSAEPISSDDEEITFKTAGWSERNSLTVQIGVVRCGDIEDGVIFRHDDDGSWVMAFSDLERIYLANKESRREGS